MSKFVCDFKVLGPVSTNCYFLYNEETKEGIIVDPGGESQKILSYIEKKKLDIKAILLTHGHFDHILAVDEVRKALGVKVYAAKEERGVLLDPDINLSSQFGKSITVEADCYLEDNESMEILGKKMRAILTPGHTKGGMCYYFPELGMLFSGDTLFQDSVGRTDFPTGSMSNLIRSVREKLFVLAPATKVYPGHGLTTSIEEEKMYNPYSGM